jgi:hypothetical protein
VIITPSAGTSRFRAMGVKVADNCCGSASPPS